MCVFTRPQMHASRCFLPAALSGVLWNTGFVGVTLALIPDWGLSVGGPCSQACLLVSGLWGVFFFREVRPLGSGLHAVSLAYWILLVLIGTLSGHIHRFLAHPHHRRPPARHIWQDTSAVHRQPRRTRRTLHFMNSRIWSLFGSCCEAPRASMNIDYARPAFPRATCFI